MALEQPAIDELSKIAERLLDSQDKLADIFDTVISPSPDISQATKTALYALAVAQSETAVEIGELIEIVDAQLRDQGAAGALTHGETDGNA